jgi:hypothetical protein
MCNKNHEKDNSLVLKIIGTTNQKFEIGCVKYVKPTE